MAAPTDRSGRTVWNTPAGPTALTVLAVDNLDELARRVAAECAAMIDDRVRPYQTSVTIETLLTPI